MNPVKKNDQKNQVAEINPKDEIMQSVKRLFMLVDAGTIKKLLIEGHIAHLKETVDFFDCTGAEISNLASINYALIKFFEDLEGSHEKIRKGSQIEAIAEV